MLPSNLPENPLPVNETGRPGPVFIDPDVLADELLRALGLRSRRLAQVTARLNLAVQVAGPAAIARVLADEAGLTLSQARRLVVLLIEIGGGGRP